MCQTPSTLGLRHLSHETGFCWFWMRCKPGFAARAVGRRTIITVSFLTFDVGQVDGSRLPIRGDGRDIIDVPDQERLVVLMAAIRWPVPRHWPRYD